MLASLLAGSLFCAVKIQIGKANGTIYIRADGSIDPPTANITSTDNVTYTFTSNINDSIVVETDNIVVDGNGSILQGTGALDSKGIYLTGRSNVTIKNTNIKRFGYGIYLLASSNNTISGNNITANNYSGVSLYSSSNNSVSGNNITANNNNGIDLIDSPSNSVSGNNITANNWYGIGLYSSSNYNRISGNNITNNGAGIGLYSSSNYNRISGNNITANNVSGIWLLSSSNNRVFHNNFINNAQQVYSTDSANVWDDGYPSGGNYWSDYTGVDFLRGVYQNESGSDGIGDVPYIIYDNNRDIYPLASLNPRRMIYILVNSSIYGDVKNCTDRYVSDVNRLGFDVYTLSINESSPEAIREILVNAYSGGLVGCLLVGDIPWAWFEMYEDPSVWNYDYERFPIDLFYMDLDGVWSDSNRNGTYDQHTGDRAPEIWVGRIKASDMDASEVSLIQNYFDKNHAYRTGALSLPNRALIYIDDDWVNDYSNRVDSAVRFIYDNRSLVNENITTRPADYLYRLNQGWSLVHLMVHGEPNLHYFMTNGEPVGNVTSSNITSTDPHAFFYILYSCQNARYTETDYIGGWYVFSKTYGVAAVSSTKVGGMLYFMDFYSNSSQESLGYSFQKWLEGRVAQEDADPTFGYNSTWYYGMTILGDPTLFLTISDVAITNIFTSKTIVGKGPSMGINISVTNEGYRNETVKITVSANKTSIATFTNITLTSGNSTTISFTWNTTGFAKGNYTISAYAEPVPGETDTTDNNFTGGWVIVAMIGDITGSSGYPDGKIDARDVAGIASRYGAKPPDPRYDPNWDITGPTQGLADGEIDARDVALVSSRYGQKDP
jgi:parallel beta-helix repeat protein